MYVFTTHVRRMMEMNRLREEVCRYKEMGLAYEHSLCSKDQIIENLTLGLHKAVRQLERLFVVIGIVTC